MRDKGARWHPVCGELCTLQNEPAAQHCSCQAGALPCIRDWLPRGRYVTRSHDASLHKTHSRTMGEWQICPFFVLFESLWTAVKPGAQCVLGSPAEILICLAKMLKSQLVCFRLLINNMELLVHWESLLWRIKYPGALLINRTCLVVSPSV